MSLNAYALTTVARYKSFAGISGVTQDTKIEYIINIVSDWVETFCDRRFIKTTYTEEIYDGNGYSKLLLRNYPVDSSSAFQIDERDSDFNDNHWSLVDSEFYFTDLNAGIVECIGRTFREVPQKYRITYTAGYLFDNVTGVTTLESAGIGDLEYAVWKLITNVIQKGGNVSGIKAESIGNYSVTYGDYQLMDLDIKMVLDKYKRYHSM